MPGLLAVGEAALELLQGVAAREAAAEVERQALLGRKPDQRRDDVLHRRVAQLRVGAAAQVVVEEAVAAHGQRGGGDLAAGGVGERQPGVVRFEDPVEVGGGEEVALGGAGPTHRLLVGGEEAGALRRRRLRAGNDRDLVARAAVLVDPVAVAAAALRRQRRVGDLDDVALRRPGQRRPAERVADEDRDEAGGREVDLGRVEHSPPRRGRALVRYAVQTSTALGRWGHSRVAVGGDRVAGVAAGDLADDQRCDERRGAGVDAQRVSDALGVEKGARAEELLALGRRAAVGEQLGGRGHGSRSAAAARNSSGNTPQTSQSSVPSGRFRWPRIVPSCFQPSPVTVFLAISLRAGMRP